MEIVEGQAVSLTVQIKSDSLTPSLRRGLRAAKDPRPVWTAGLTQILSITKRSFTDASMRTAAWPNKKAAKIVDGKFELVDGGPSKLIFKGTLLSSIRIVGVDAEGGSIGSDRVYAAIHQLGGIIRPKNAGSLVFSIGGVTIRAKKVTIPARPFFPFQPDGHLAPAHSGSVLRIMDVAMKKRLGIP